MAPDLKSFEWPAKQAEKVKLFVPESYNPYQSEGSPAECFLRYNTEHESLVLTSGSDNEILDIIAIEDLIGAEVEVELLGSSVDPRVSNAAFRNQPVADGPSSPVDGGIFQSLESNKDKVFTVRNPSTDDNAPSSPIPFDTQAAAVLTLYVYPRKDPKKQSMLGSCTGKSNLEPNKEFSKNGESKEFLHRYAHHRRFQIAPSEDFSNVSTLVKAIRQVACPTRTESDRLLIVVNPFSGRKKGLQIFETYVVSMLEQAGIDYDHVITDRAGHSQELMRPQESANANGVKDISNYTGIVVIGGDGSVYEVMQGIQARSDCNKILSSVTIGHIGGGTSNGLSATLAHANHEHFNPLDYTFIIAKGTTVQMDLSKYQTKSNEYLSFLTFSWAFIADVDIESEVLRWLGFLRMDVYSAWRVISRRSYRAKVSYLPESAGKLDALAPLDQPLPKEQGWKTIEDDLTLLWVSQVTHAGESVHSHPHSKPDDGLFHIFMIRNSVSRLRLLLILLALESGGHVDMEGAEFISCTAYRLEPITEGSYNDLDGEVIESGPIQGIVLPGAIRAYCTL